MLFQLITVTLHVKAYIYQMLSNRLGELQILSLLVIFSSICNDVQLHDKAFAALYYGTFLSLDRK